jgi:hypothetical protein
MGFEAALVGENDAFEVTTWAVVQVIARTDITC